MTEIEPEDDLGVVAAEGAGVDVAEEGRADGANGLHQPISQHIQ